MTKLRQVCAAAVLATMAGGPAVAETTASVGIMSDYIWRGIYTSDASAFGSIDIQADSGFYMGLWGADVTNGLEYDFYVGYAGGGENLTWNAGFTGYYFTDEIDDTYMEINLGVNYGFLDYQYALGEYDANAIIDWCAVAANNCDRTRPQTYQYHIATFAPAVGPYYVVGRGDYQNVRNTQVTGKKGMWVEIGKDFELADGLELNIAGIYTPDAGDVNDQGNYGARSVMLSPTNPMAEFAAVMSITKTVTLGD